ncbi:MAG: AraC family transcriptional regulator [Hyphomicrobiales bacterium]|nr:MAG: AraC family transcriptional regulator [Hyphomicrobiales bacterium]
MTGTPPILSETPEAANDPLSDLLATMQLAGTVLFCAEFREPWSIETPEACQIARAVRSPTDHLIPFHVIASGACDVALPDGDPVAMRAGDAVILPYGSVHLLKGAQPSPTVQIDGLLPDPPWQNMPVLKHGGNGDTTHIICGFVQCDELLFHPLLRHLPPMLHVRPDETPGDQWLATTIRHTATEALAPSPGSRSMLPRLTELMFVAILRKYMHGLSQNEVGWFAAFNDPIAGGALRAIHAAPLHDWTVEALARQIGSSRTVLAERFKHYLGEPPIRYVANWRLLLAAQKLKASALPLKMIAEEAGYESEAAFNRAFKRRFGLPPGDWRSRQTQTL